MYGIARVQPFYSLSSEAVDPLVYSTASSDTSTASPGSGGVRQAVLRRQLTQLFHVHSGAGVSQRLVDLQRGRESVLLQCRSEEMAPQSSGALRRPARR